MSEQKIIVRGVEFTWELISRDDGNVVKVSNSLYGSSERRTQFSMEPKELAYHVATELLRRSPRARSFSQETSLEGYNPYDTGPEKD